MIFSTLLVHYLEAIAIEMRRNGFSVVSYAPLKSASHTREGPTAFPLYTTIVKSTRYRFGVSTRKDLYTHYRNLLQVCNKFR